MNKDRLNQIVQVLIVPYTSRDFLKPEKDVIKNVRIAFRKFSEVMQISISQRNKAEKQFFQAQSDLENFIRTNINFRAKSLDDLKLLFDVFFPEDEILFEMECVGDDAGGVDYYYIEQLFRIAGSLLTFRDGKISLRTWMNKGDEELFKGQDTFDKVELWNLLNRSMVTDVLIAAFFLCANMRDTSYLYNQNGGISLADKVLDTILKKGIAETHMHLNAGVEYMMLWKAVTGWSYWKKAVWSEVEYRKCQKRNPEIGINIFIYRILFAEFLRIRQEGDEFLGYISTEFSAESAQALYKLMEDFYCGRYSEYNPYYKNLLEEIGILFENRYGEIDEKGDFLFQTVYYQEKEYRTFSELVLLVKILGYLKDNSKDGYSARLFLQYLRIKNIYFSDIMQSGYIGGLNNFQKYYGKASRELRSQTEFWEEDVWESIFRGQSQNVNLKKMEVRVAPSRIQFGASDSLADKRNIKLDILKTVEHVLKSYISYAQNMTGYYDDDDFEEQVDSLFEREICGFPSIGIVFHFLKTDYLDNRIGNMCWVQYAKKYNQFSKHMLIWRKKMVEYAQCIEELRSEIPYLNEYLVGIDAASEEVTTEPWVIAPVFQAIRNKKTTKILIRDKEQAFRRITNIGFTYHVGEEFRHIISGLRHIDEVLEHFNYKPGDRLGHAIALGEDVFQWVKENEVITIPIMEWMQNLIWLWGGLVQDRIHMQISIPYLEGKILELAEKIYGTIDGMTPLMLFQVYQDMFRMDYDAVFESYCAKLDDKDKEKEGEETDNETHFCKYYNKKFGVYWTREKLLCTFFCPSFNMRFRKPMLIRVGETMSAAMLKELQKQMIRKVEQMGIYVETNPTSNIAIGNSRRLFSHYILTLNTEGLVDEAEEKNAVMVTINTDDPVIFNTNIENELSYIYYALVHSKYKKERVLKWIDKVRQNSMDSSFVKKVKKPSKQVKEIHNLLNEITMFYKNVEDQRKKE